MHNTMYQEQRKVAEALTEQGDHFCQLALSIWSQANFLKQYGDAAGPRDLERAWEKLKTDTAQLSELSNAARIDLEKATPDIQ